MKYFFLIIVYLSPIFLLSQSVVITRVDADQYPSINTEYIVLDENDNKIVPQSNELELFENSILQNLINTQCDNNKTKIPVSVVLTIDNSSSMLETDGNVKNRDEIVRQSAKKFIDLLNPQSEIAVTYFSTESKIIQPLTNDINTAKQSIDNIPEPFGATYISNSFLNVTDGNFKALENSNFKKVIVFLTDGTSNEVDINNILDRAFVEDVTIYTISVYTNMDRELLTIADTTGGTAFDNINNQDKIDRVFRALALIASDIDVCKTSYISSNCELDRDLELVYLNQYKDKWELKIPKERLIEYKVSPSEINFYNDGTPSSIAYSNIVSNKDSLIITGISSVYSQFEIEEPLIGDFPIRLNTGDRLRIKVKCINGNEVKSDLLNIFSNSCKSKDISIYYSTEPNTLAIERPNGGEVFYIGSDQETNWKNENSDNVYDLEYSVNAGFDWELITNNYNAKDFIWENVPNKQTEEALYKVSKNIKKEELIKTKNIGVLDTNFYSTFEKVLALDNGGYLVSSSFKESFIYKDLFLDTVGQDQQEVNRVRKVLMILDENLDVVHHKVFISNHTEYSVTTIQNNIYMLVTPENYFTFDTFEYENNFTYSNSTLILKLDDQLDLVSVSEILNENPLLSGGNYFIDFESSSNYLHIYGASSSSLIYEKESVIDDPNSRNIFYLAKIDENLNFSEIVYWDVELDKFDISIRAILPQDNNNVLLWGTGSGYGFLGLDSNYSRVFALEANYQNNNLSIKNYIAYDDGFDFSLMDYITYKDINYYLIRTTDTTYYNNGNDIFGDRESKIRLLAISDDDKLLWDLEFDNFTLSKHLRLFNNRDLLVVGMTNESFPIGDTVIPREANLHFIGSFSLFEGKFNWIKYSINAIYLNLVTTSGNQILTTGKFYNKVDFGDGFEDEVNVLKGEVDKEYLWLLEAKQGESFDVSDSLWSIRKPSFEYIDTIDFGEVYSFTKRDSLVLDFITANGTDDITIEKITIDDFRYETDFTGPVLLNGKLDITVSLSTEFAGAGLTKGTIFTSQGNFTFYLIVKEIDDSGPITINANKIKEIDFGDVFVTENKTLSQWIARNNGSANIGIDSVIIVGDENNEFSYDITRNKDYIIAGDTLYSDFTYSPNIAGISEAEVHFYLDILREPIIAQLKGNGITRDSVRMRIILDTISSFPDRLTTIPVKLDLIDNPKSLDMKQLEVDIEYNATLLLPFRLEDEGIVINKVRKMTVLFDESDINNLIVENRFLPTIGDSISTELRVLEIRAINGKGEIIDASRFEKQNGMFTLDGVCYADGHYRLYEERNPTSLRLQTANEIYIAKINLIEKGMTNLSVFDINGKLVTTLIARELEQGEFRTEINTDFISSGIYIIQLETSTERISKVLTISK